MLWGKVIAVLLALVLTDWRYLQVATTGLSLMVGIVWFFISESPRWLIVTGKIKEAKDVIEVASKKNKFDAINESNEDKNINPDDIENYYDNRSESTFNTMFPPSDEENYGKKM